MCVQLVDMVDSLFFRKVLSFMLQFTIHICEIVFYKKMKMYLIPIYVHIITIRIFLVELVDIV